jgi:hypothetical protein
LLIPQAQNPYASHALPPAISEKSHALDLSVYASSNAEHPPQLPDMRKCANEIHYYKMVTKSRGKACSN